MPGRNVTMRTSRIPIVVSLVALVVAACGGSSSPAPAASSAASAPSTTAAAPTTAASSSSESTAAASQASSAAAGSNAVEMKNIAFNPTSVTVKPGDKVTWTNNDSFAHTVTLDDNSVDSGEVAAGATFENTFATAGTFAYHCKIHAVMHATVTVTP
jgi:plastocyanin